MATGTHNSEQFVGYRQLRSLLGNLRLGVFTVDAERKITSFNRAAEHLTGHQAKDVIGKRCHEVFLNDLCIGECKYHEAVEAEQQSLSFDVTITNAHHEKLVVTKIVTPLYDGRRRLIGCMEVFQDRSAFEELINRIRYDQRQLKIILDNLDIGILTVTRGGLVTFFNCMAESITGYNRTEVLGKACAMILGEGSGETLMLKAIADGKPRSQKGFVQAKDGRAIPAQANYLALRNEQSRVVGGLATVQDLSLIDQLSREIRNRYTYDDMVGKAPGMQRIFEILPVIAESDATVLIEGATGTGKDLLAKVIHNSSARARKALVKVNCAALPDNLLESEMFGYARGAFTGAERDKPGRFEEADGGTIFLDEIGDLPLSLQAKLLRVLEDREFYPLGSRKTTRVDVRILAATNQGLERLVGEKRFREDLFYRLNVIRLELPPLCERKGDLPLMIRHILRKLSAGRKQRPFDISEPAMEILLNYDYPGNVRELENILEHALILCGGENIERCHLPLAMQRSLPPQAPASDAPQPVLREPTLPEKERILAALEEHQWHRGRAARTLQMDRSTLWRKMKRHGLLQ